MCFFQGVNKNTSSFHVYYIEKEARNFLRIADHNYAKCWPFTSSDNYLSPCFFESSCVGKVSPEKDVFVSLEIKISTFEGSTVSIDDPFIMVDFSSQLLHLSHLSHS